MTKEQFAEKKYPFPDENKEKKAFLLGWEAREAQFLTDAVNFVHQILKEGWLPLDDSTFYKEIKAGGRIIKGIRDLYQLFNPSGAAPQAFSAHVDIYFLKSVKEKINDAANGLVDYDFLNELNEAIKNQPKTAPQAAGPIWVNELERVPNHYRNIYAKYKILHLGVPTSVNIILRYNVSSEKWITQQGEDFTGYLDLFWLDESNTPQVFTRQQISDAFHAGIVSGLDSAHDRPFITQDEYMNTNYPTSK